MIESDRAWMEEWSAGVRVWVERAGEALAGPGRLQLLEAIDRSNSISAAAREIGMSYRHAWRMVQEMNAAAGEPLVAAATGGTHGGGASLTQRGRSAVGVLRQLQGQAGHAVRALLRRLLDEAESTCVRVFAAISLEDVLEQLLADYAALQPAAPVRAIFGASDELRHQILSGASADLFLSADPASLTGLERAGLIEPATIARLAENSLAAVGRLGRQLSVHAPADLLHPSVARIALATEECPLGRYTRRYLERVGLGDAVGKRAVPAENARAVVSVVQAGKADVGLVYRSAAATTPGCRLLFGVRRTGSPIHYAGGVIAGSRRAEQARHLLAFLQSAAAAARFRRCGFLPASA
ncbi:hypothetical protein AYO40_05085 [Planctomycetaceae bacterium SCGC AG-212-D15]|nr:hypothetical protein AYO40_05085 [Planctomycetaceae bacterium SCGC AG-212-D15]